MRYILRLLSLLLLNLLLATRIILKEIKRCGYRFHGFKTFLVKSDRLNAQVTIGA